MNRYLMTTAAVALAGTVLAGSPAGATTTPGITGQAAAWGKAEEVPGTAALNSGGTAGVMSVSCAAAGNCSAGGYYSTRSASQLSQQAFVASQVNGTWGTAEEVPGTAALDKGGNAEVFAVSCASPGNCSAGGYYQDKSRHRQAFVVSQVNGTWGTAEEVPGTATLNTGDAVINSVSCASAGNCTAGGFYRYSPHHLRALVVSQVNGAWGKAEQIPGLAALNKHGDTTTDAVSCASPGNCSAGGSYDSSYGTGQAFAVSQVNGTWGEAEEVPGTAALNKGHLADLDSVSCASPGNCSAGGSYAAGRFSFQAYVVSQVNGTWGNAAEVPGSASLNTSHEADIDSVSCASAGNCSAGGYYSGKSSNLYALVVSQVHGTWAKAAEVTGIGSASVDQVSCASAGDCSAGGSYGAGQAYVVSQAHGAWAKAEEVPGSAALNKGRSAGINSVSCAPAGGCSAGGSYTDGSGDEQAFVVSQAG